MPTTYTQNTSDGTAYLNQYAAVGGNAVTNGSEHQIAAYQNVAYSYINDGRLRQAQLKDSAGNVTDTYKLAYDALGRCVKRTLDGNVTYFYYDGEKPIQEEGATLASNIYGLGIDEIVVRFEPTHIYYFYQDHEGSITHVRDNNSGPKEQYRYDAFGMPTIRDGAGTTIYTTSQINNRFMFTGREWAPVNLGFYEYRARAYSPVLGRFMSEDPKGFVRNRGLGAEPDKWSFNSHPDEAEFNLFRYCDNDPLDFIDPMGLTDIDVPRDIDLAGRDAALNSLHEAQRRGDGQNLSQLVVRVGGELTVQTGIFNRQIEGTTHAFQDRRLKILPYNQEIGRTREGETYVTNGHVHLDQTGRDPHGRPNPASPHPSMEDREGGLGYRVNESNPNVILRNTPQKEGGPAVERALDARTMKRIDPPPKVQRHVN